MKRLTLDLRTVTPAFLCGGGEEAEWRGASVRGQLRWWFRAVAGGALGGDLGGVRAMETAVFGDTERSSPLTVVTLGRPKMLSEGASWSYGGDWRAEELAENWGVGRPRGGEAEDEYTSTVKRLRVVLPSRDGSPPQEVPSRPVDYLAFGAAWKGKLIHSCIHADQPLQLRLQWQDRRWRGIDEEARRLFDHALWAWLHLGGIGAKSRKGFGSLSCDRSDARGNGGPFLQPATTRDEVASGAARILALAREVRGSAADWTHLTADSRIFLAAAAASSWSEALARAGGWLVAFRRRYGWPADHREIDGTPLADRDYAWAAPRGKHRRGGIPDRSGFGLPLPFGQGGETVTWHERGGAEDKDQRRASPLLLHVARVGNLFLPVFTYLPARFLPPEGRLKFKDKASPTGAPTKPQLDVVHHFLDDLEAKKLIEEVRP